MPRHRRFLQLRSAWLCPTLVSTAHRHRRSRRCSSTAWQTVQLGPDANSLTQGQYRRAGTVHRLGEVSYGVGDTVGLFPMSAVGRSLFAVGQYHRYSVRCSARVGLETDPLPAVYSRPDRFGWGTRVAAASLYADDTQSFGSCRRCTLHSFRAAWLRVLMTSGYGCGPTGCSSAWQRRTYLTHS